MNVLCHIPKQSNIWYFRKSLQKGICSHQICHSWIKIFSAALEIDCIQKGLSPHALTSQNPHIIPTIRNRKGSLSPNSRSEENQSQNQARQVGALPLRCWKPLTACLFLSISSCCFPPVFLKLQIQLYEWFPQKFMKNTQEEFCMFQVSKLTEDIY